MKLLRNSIITLIAFFAVYVGLGGIYKVELYNLAMDFEAGLSGLEEKSLALPDGEIRYYENQQEGKKPTVLLIHGFAAYKENWLRFARPLKDDFHVIALDLPGHGKSFKNPEYVYSLTNQAKWVNQFLSALEINKVHIAGNSMGGAISTLFSANYPEKVLSTTLLNPGGIQEHRPELMDYIDRGENPLVVTNAQEFSFLMDFALEQKPFVPWPITEVLAERASSLAELHHKVRQDTMPERGEAFEPVLHKVQSPTLIVWGKQDRICHYRNAEVFDRYIANSKVAILDGVGHAPMVEIPNESAAMLVEHIESGISIATVE